MCIRDRYNDALDCSGVFRNCRNTIEEEQCNIQNILEKVGNEVLGKKRISTWKNVERRDRASDTRKAITKLSQISYLQTRTSKIRIFISRNVILWNTLSGKRMINHRIDILIIHRTTSVSYTHLDVYKRQTELSPAKAEYTRVFPGHVIVSLRSHWCC